MKEKLRIFMCILLVGALCCVVLAFCHGPIGKWLSSAGLMFDIAVIVQVDKPIQTWLRNTLFFKTRTGFRLIIIGFFFQLAGTWC